MRNNYFVGKRLTPDALQLEQRYLNERRHLINRAVHGHGVVYGFGIGATPAASYDQKSATGRLRIGPGLAFDELGRELVQTAILDLKFENVHTLNADGNLVNHVESPEGACWLLRVHYAEKDRGPVMTSDSCSCEKREWDQVCETVRFTLQQVDCAICCDESPCELQCDCAPASCCDDVKITQSKKMERSCDPMHRGGSACLCEHLTGLEPGTDCVSLCELDEDCGRVRVDLRHGVVLACVGLRADDCGGWVFDGRVEYCGPRRLVKRNDLLFDLIRGADLTRLCAIGWAPWHRRSTIWSDFVASFGSEDATSGQNPTDNYWVEFSRPVRADSLTPACFTMTVIVPEVEGGWRESLRVPIVDVRVTADIGVPAGMATRAQLVVDTAWVNDALISARTRFGAGAEVEIEIRGDYITDCNGQQVDANARGLSPVPSGNGSPGGSFISTFRVEPKPSKAIFAQGVKS
jgi:hypothetical protein